MKRKAAYIIVSAAISINCFLPAYSADTNPKSAEPVSFWRKTSVTVQKVTGITDATNLLLSLTAYTVLKVILGGKVRAKVNAPCFTDLLSGHLSKLDISLKNSSYRKIPLGNLRVKTQGPISLRYFKHKDQRAGLTAPVVMAVSAQMDENQISKALITDAVASKLRFLKLELPGLGSQYLQILEPKVKLENNKIYIDSWLVTAGASKDSGVKLNISATPELQAQRFIVLKDTQITSTDIIEPEQFAKFAEDLLNPLVDLGRMDRATHAMRLNNVSIDESKVSFEGNLLLAPKPNLQIATQKNISTK